jgi:hypothetical protein
VLNILAPKVGLRCGYALANAGHDTRSFKRQTIAQRRLQHQRQAA